ncbi:MAG: threonine ammonia-lyase [Thermoleophilia bacterium]|nr:threonine ammonia-lyase [Thermoleophilia bacterium]
MDAPGTVHGVGVTLDDIRAARDRISGRIRSTPMLHKQTLDPIVGHPVYMKCEHLQRTGSFKLRGALNLVAQLDDAERARGVVAASAGNHAQGVAVAASEFGVEATIFMPEDASLAKVEATKAYGAQVQLAGEHLTATLEAAHAFCEERGAVFVHPFDDDRIIAGQGTLGLEVVEQLPEVATVVVPVGGGGLAAGVATAVRALRPDCRIVAVQAASFPSLRASIEAGTPTAVEASPTIADGIAVKQLGARTFTILRELVDEVVEVEEEELSTAILWGMERAKQVLEGAGAASLAALLAGKVRTDGPVALVVAGGNIDPANLIPVIRHGLSAVGRFLYVGTVIPDRPGELSRLLGMLARARVNVLGVEHHREGVDLRIGETRVDLTLQTRNAEHVAEVEALLTSSGYPLLRSVC